MVFDQLVARFKVAPPVHLSECEFQEWKEKKQRSTQQRVLTLFTMWLEDHNMIKEDPHIVHRLQGFLQSIVEPHPLAIPAKLIIEAIERLVRHKDRPRFVFVPDTVPESCPSCSSHPYYACTNPEAAETAKVSRNRTCEDGYPGGRSTVDSD